MNPAVINYLCRWIIVAVVWSVGLTGRATAAETPAALFASLEPAAPDPAQSHPAAEGWHQDAVVYHLWVAAFRDSDGNGVGACAASFKASTPCATWV